MRKRVSVIACFIAFVLLLCTVTAYGESCYDAIKDLLSVEGVFLGEPESIPDHDQNGDVSAYYNVSEQTFYLEGFNSQGEGERCVWKDVGNSFGYYVIFTLCDNWNAFNAVAEQEHHSMRFGITGIAEGQDELIIDDADSAETLANIVKAQNGWQ